LNTSIYIGSDQKIICLVINLFK